MNVRGNGGLLLSGLHHNTSVTKLFLVYGGFEGVMGGQQIAALLRTNTHLQDLVCGRLSLLGPQGLSILSSGLQANETLKSLVLDDCELGDHGASLIANAIHGSSNVEKLHLTNNGITSNGLPHVTRLLEHDSLGFISIDQNPGLFDNEMNSSAFASGLSRIAKLKVLSAPSCQMPAHAVISLFMALTINTTLAELDVYDHTRLHGQDLERLLEMIPKLKAPSYLRINLDVTDTSVLSSLHWNTSILRLSVDEDGSVVTDGPAFGIMHRNRRLSKASVLLKRESRGGVIPPWGGLWAKGIERLTDDPVGATAAYKILHEKLVMWWAPEET